MTCIVGIQTKEKVYLGGDSAAVDSDFGLLVSDEPKVFENGPYLIGYAGSFRVGQLLQYATLPNLPSDPAQMRRFLVQDFVDALRNAVASGGASFVKHEEESLLSSLLVGVSGQLYRIDEDFQVLKVATEYAAVGCGEPLALGALYAAPKNKTPEERIRIALEAAETFSAGVRGPFTILSN